MATYKININGVETAVLDAGETLREVVPPGCEPAGPGAISAWVAGVPAPQGSKRALGAGRRGGKIRMVESSKKLKPWRAAVREMFTLGGEPCRFLPGTAVVVTIVFVMPRPVATPKTRATPPAVKKPDVDKLVRAVLDGISAKIGAGVIADDSQVVTVHAHKRIAELGEPTGAMIHIERDPSRCQPACRMLKNGQGGHPGPCMLSSEERVDMSRFDPTRQGTYSDEHVRETGRHGRFVRSSVPR